MNVWWIMMTMCLEGEINVECVRSIIYTTLEASGADDINAAKQNRGVHVYEQVEGQQTCKCRCKRM